ncbi:aspartyl-phosphate phosphatase Spo0E family protein [Bacillus tuaregi]|uniref:aspartyl-phosphate phosphatase Spo0E family protein n=1 Tax=Bacillus tuaregi TaxID=1816695 RepID=UPI0008F8ECCD|nr:aspartyl-phosphate phosphatase Spo0E family protein [Bacillus tuaregi]
MLESIHDELLEMINIKRKNLIEIGMKKGLTDLETVKCSQELDDMINSFYRKQENLTPASLRKIVS